MKEYDLKRSYEKIGVLYPALVMEDGTVIDGYHRLRVDPKWPKTVVKKVRDPVQQLIARLHANVCRRKVPAKEKTDLLMGLAELTGWDPKRIAEETGMSYTWVTKYLPAEYKDKEMRELATRRVAGAPEAEPVKKSTLLDRLMKYYPMPLLDIVWKYVREPAKQERVAYILIGVLAEYAEQQGVEEELAMKAIKIAR